MACDPDAGCPAGLGAECLMPLCWRPTANLITSASLSSAALDGVTEQFNLAELSDRILNDFQIVWGQGIFARPGPDKGIGKSKSPRCPLRSVSRIAQGIICQNACASAGVTRFK